MYSLGLRDRKIADLVQKMTPTKLSEIPPQLEKKDTVFVKISGNHLKPIHHKSHFKRPSQY